MRALASSWLALSAVLISQASALHAVDQQPLLPNSQRSTWRLVSDKIINSIFSPVQQVDQSRPITAGGPARQAPAHTLAQYESDVVLRFNISTSEEAKSLAEAAETLLLDIWEFSANWVDIRLSVDIVAPLLGLLPASLQHAHTPLLRERELAQAVFNTYPAAHDEPVSTRGNPFNEAPRAFTPTLQAVNGPEYNVFFADYQPLSVIEPWMRLMSSLFSTHVRHITVGQSGSGRAINGLRIGVHPAKTSTETPPKRGTVLIVGGIHAREWIGTSTALYVAYHLMTQYGKTSAVTSLLEEFDFVVVPTINPDGYVYTWESDRLWRKNRQQTAIRFCKGIDIDRSFDFEWNGDAQAMSSPCSESFAGEEPFQATEALQLSEWALNQTRDHNVEFIGFLDLHSYSQAVLYPYSYSCEDEPPGLENLAELAYGLQRAIRLSQGHVYEVMPACEGNVAVAGPGSTGRQILPRMEPAGGSCLDWFYHTLHVRYAYQLKLRDRGAYGFLLPREQIVPTGKEIVDAVLYFGDFLMSKLKSDVVQDSDKRSRIFRGMKSTPDKA